MQEDVISGLYDKNNIAYHFNVFATRLTLSLVDKTQKAIFDTKFEDDNTLLVLFEEMLTDISYGIYSRATLVFDVISLTLINDRFDRLIRLSLLKSTKLGIQTKLKDITTGYGVYDVNLAREMQRINSFGYQYTDEMAVDIYISLIIYNADIIYTRIGFKPLSIDTRESYSLDQLFVLQEEKEDDPVYPILTIQNNVQTKLNLCRLWPVTCGKGLFSQPLYRIEGSLPLSLMERVKKASDTSHAIRINSRIIARRRYRFFAVSEYLIRKITMYVNELHEKELIEREKEIQEEARQKALKNEAIEEEQKLINYLANERQKLIANKMQNLYAAFK